MSGESIIKFADEDACREAIKEVRQDKSENDWVLIGYEGSTGPAAQRLKLVAKGGGGVESLKEQLTDNILGYALLRTTDQIDESITTKFVFINWLGENAPRMQKSRISIHIGPVKQFFGQSHTDLVASHSNELTHEIIMQKIMDASGSGSRVIDASTGGKQLDAQAHKRVGSVSARGGAKAVGNSDQVAFVPEDELKNLLRDVRQGVDGLQWALLTYEDPKSNNVVLLAKGTGGIDDELKTHLKDDLVAYGLVRKVDKIDESETIKFCFINYVGENINRMLRARLGTHKGAVNKFFAPYHVDVNPEKLDEFSDEGIVKLIKTTSGSESKVLSDDKTIRTAKVVATKKVGDGAAAPAPSSNAPASAVTPAAAAPSKRPTSVSYGRPKGGSVSGGSDQPGLSFDNEEAIRAGIKSVRDDSNDINWALVSYDGPRSKTLTLVGTGNGGVAELKEKLKDDIVGYALVRLVEVVDQSQTVKFCFVNWTGKSINHMMRASLTTRKGMVTQLFSPYHVDLECETQDEISEEILYGKIKKASGTAVYVL